MNKSQIIILVMVLAVSSFSNFSFAEDPDGESDAASSCNDIGGIIIYDINGAEIIRYCLTDVLNAAITQSSVTEQNGNLVIEGYDSTDAYPKITSELEQRLRGLEILLEHEQLPIENDERFIEVMVYVKEPPSIVPLPDYAQVRFELETILQVLVPIDKIYELESDPNVSRISSVERPHAFGVSNEMNGRTVSELSPKQQMKQGVSPENILCKEELELIFKSTDNSPACVKPTTAEKLIERGWASG